MLVAEDDERVRRVVRGMLAQAGYRVSVAEDGAQALALCAGEDAPDLVVSDMVMPNLDGAALWKALEKQGGIPVLIMSGYADNGLASRFEDHSDLVVLSKPFRSQELLRLVRRLLDAPTP